MRYLFDTNILIRWTSESDKLSREQLRVLEKMERGSEQIGVSAMSLVELAAIQTSRRNVKGSLSDIFDRIDEDHELVLLQITTEVAREAVACGTHLRDPADRIIVATARVHNLILVTSDELIIDSGLVPTIG